MTTYRFPEDAGTKVAGGNAEAIAAHLRALGLPAQQVRVRREDDAVILEGEVPDAAARERIVLACGNLASIGRVEDRMTVVRRSDLLDTLAGFARLPGGSASTQAAEREMHAAQPERGEAFGPGGSLLHTVQPGETLEGIAQRHYGMTREVRRLLEANAPMLGDERALRPGMVLRIPLGRPTRPVSK
jgi:nucleoid-associated protein YgaU